MVAPVAHSVEVLWLIVADTAWTRRGVRSIWLVLGVLMLSLVAPATATATATAADAAATSRYVPVSPVRLLDTRTGLGAVQGRPAAGETIDLQVTGVGGVPSSGVTAVTLNVTVTDTRQNGYVQVLPMGSGTQGSSSNLNVTGPMQTAANFVTVPVGAGGMVSIFDVAGGHLIADVQGFFTEVSQSAEGRYTAVAPTRLLDSRNRTGMPSLLPANPGDTQNCSSFATWSDANSWFWTYYPYFGDVANLDGDGNRVPCEALAGNPGRVVEVHPIDFFPMPAAGTGIELQVAGRGGVPASGVSSVALTVTATNSAGPGYVQVVPTGGSTSLGSTSNVNLTGGGQTVANLVIVPIGTGGTVQLYNSSGTDVIADVVGYFTDTTAETSAAGLFVPVTPGRLMDTRVAGPVASGSETLLAPGGAAGLPTTGMGAVFLNLTATQTAGAGFLQVFPSGLGVPGASSSVNFTGAGQTVASAAVGGLGSEVTFSVYTPTSTHVVIDVAGYFTDGTTALER